MLDDKIKYRKQWFNFSLSHLTGSPCSSWGTGLGDKQAHRPRIKKDYPGASPQSLTLLLYFEYAADVIWCWRGRFSINKHSLCNIVQYYLRFTVYYEQTTNDILSDRRVRMIQDLFYLHKKRKKSEYPVLLGSRAINKQIR